MLGSLREHAMGPVILPADRYRDAMLDALIIGGGPAGLSAALVLGRCRRSVLVVDAGQQRNRRSEAMNGYLTRDGIPPSEFLLQARSEVARYGVEKRACAAIDARRERDGSFTVELEGGETLRARTLLLATGVRDALPAIEGLDSLYGTSVHHCPYCDGWQHRDRRLVAYGSGDASVGLALTLRTWSEHVTACSAGDAPTSEFRGHAERNGIGLRESQVVRLEAQAGVLHRVVFADGTTLECDALFFNTAQAQRSDLPRRLGCTFKEDGGVRTDDRQCTGIPGLYLAGDAEKEVQFVIVAAAEGAVAATAINRELQRRERGV